MLCTALNLQRSIGKRTLDVILVSCHSTLSHPLLTLLSSLKYSASKFAVHWLLLLRQDPIQCIDSRSLFLHGLDWTGWIFLQRGLLDLSISRIQSDLGQKTLFELDERIRWKVDRDSETVGLPGLYIHLRNAPFPSPALTLPSPQQSITYGNPHSLLVRVVADIFFPSYHDRITNPTAAVVPRRHCIAPGHPRIR